MTCAQVDVAHVQRFNGIKKTDRVDDKRCNAQFLLRVDVKVGSSRFVGLVPIMTCAISKGTRAHTETSLDCINARLLMHPQSANFASPFVKKKILSLVLYSKIT